MLIDLHMHSSESDGTDEPENLLDLIALNNIKIFSLTDHDNINGVKRIESKLNNYKDLKFIRGVELSCKTKNIKCHILAFNYDYDNQDFKAVLKLAEDLRHVKLEQRLKFLRENFGINFKAEEIEILRDNKASGKPHIANLIVKHGFAANKEDAIKNFINKFESGDTRVDAELAIKAVLKAKGVPVWAHPFGGEGEPEISQELLNLSLIELKTYGLRGLECYYSKYNLERREYLASLALKNNLLISAGSDYHGKNKNIKLGIDVEDLNKVTILNYLL
ncbi:MAG: PHP domain-containing protein [Synergistaceae bacterium]|nr:PHP domain-containing protein [Synergistaceae bacterium]